jgi:uncharacterized membrane protein
VKTFLKKYDVHYIIVGQQERVRFSDGMAKFDENNGKLWKEVYRQANTIMWNNVNREADTVIYEVLP